MIPCVVNVAPSGPGYIAVVRTTGGAFIDCCFAPTKRSAHRRGLRIIKDHPDILTPKENA